MVSPIKSLVRRCAWIFTLNYFFILFLSAISLQIRGQDFSNKGKNFWVVYPDHVDGINSAMGLYMTSNVNATGNIRVGSRTIPFTVTANTITRKFISSNPSADAPNVGIIQQMAEGIQSNAGIQIIADQPIVVYAHIINAARSGASLILPVPVLGREYIIPSNSSTGNGGAGSINSGYGEITIVAPESSTSIEIITVARSRNGLHSSGDTIRATINNPGDVYQVQFDKDADISGTRVRSIPSPTGGCKPIAVFSASTWSAFDCAGSSGGDNLYQQLFPVKSWGRTFYTAPFITKPYDIIRVFVNEASPRVFVTQNGVRTLMTSLSSKGFYEIKTSNPLKIESEGAPISVVQYMASMSCDPRNPPNCYQTLPPSCPYPSDPEMVVINPIEQTINNITVFSARQNWVPANQSNVTQCFLNIIIKTVYAPSFRINGNSPGGTFSVIPGTDYSYLQENVSTLSQSNPVQNLQADSPFVAIAYGYGSVESYGYNAGANVKDLSQNIVVKNPLRTVDVAVACRNSPFILGIQLAYQPTQIRWTCPDIALDTTLPAPVADSIWIQDGRTRYRYTLQKNLITSRLGQLPVKVTVINPTADGCGNQQEIEYDLEIFERPKAVFTVSTTGCRADPVLISDNTTITGGRPLYRWNWDVGTGLSVNSPSFPVTFPTRGVKTIRLSVISDVGCVSDTTSQQVSLSERPLADFNTSLPQCPEIPLTIADRTQTIGETLVKWYWRIGSSPIDSLVAATPRVLSFPAPVDVPITLAVRTNTGCLSDSVRKTIRIHPSPEADFKVPEVCVSDATAIFKDLSRISDGTAAGFIYRWNFGILRAPATQKDVSTSVPAAATYPISLIVTSTAGCRDTVEKNFVVNGAIPEARFVLAQSSPLCSNVEMKIKDQSTVDFGKITKTVLYWDVDNQPLDSTIDQDPSSGKIYSKKYPDFGSPANKPYRIRMVAYSGETCSDVLTQPILLHASPQLRFDSMPAVCQELPTFRLGYAIDQSGLPGAGFYAGPGVSAGSMFAPSVAGPGRHLIRFTQTTNIGCTAFREGIQEVFPTPTLDVGPDKAVLEGDSILLTAKAVGIGLQYIWNPAKALNDPRRLQPIATPKVDTRYQLRITSSNGCSAIDDLMILVLNKPIASNTFTPNGDGINDTWVVKHLERYPGAQVEVYSTAGQLLFRQVGYSGSWDGTWRGKPLPVGTYYYAIDPKNGRPPFAGYVTIYR